MNKSLQNYLIIYSLAIVVSIVILFNIKNKVINQSNHLKWLNNQLSQINSNISICESEFAYLSRPERIAKLYKKYFNLNKPKKEQIEFLEVK